jgi:hypothetical protein
VPFVNVLPDLAVLFRSFPPPGPGNRNDLEILLSTNPESDSGFVESPAFVMNLNRPA